MLAKHREVTAGLKIKLYECSEQKEYEKKTLETLTAQGQVDLDVIQKLQKRYQSVAEVVHQNVQTIEDLKNHCQRY